MARSTPVTFTSLTNTGWAISTKMGLMQFIRRGWTADFCRRPNPCTRTVSPAHGKASAGAGAAATGMALTAARLEKTTSANLTRCFSPMPSAGCKGLHTKGFNSLVFRHWMWNTVRHKTQKTQKALCGLSAGRLLFLVLPVLPCSSVPRHKNKTLYKSGRDCSPCRFEHYLISLISRMISPASFEKASRRSLSCFFTPA